MRRKLLLIMVFVVACVFAPELAIAKRKVVYMLDASVKKTMGISLAELRAKSVSSIVLKVEKEKVEVFLYSKKEEIETIQKPSCGEAVGDKKRRGHYMLVSVKGGLVTSKIVLGDNYFFVEGLLKPWLNDGLRTFLRIEGNVFAIYQHLGCTTKSLEFFRLKGDGTIIKVHFQNKDGLDFTKIFTGFQGETGHYKEPHIFCTPYTAIKHTFCMSYNFTGKSFEQARSWAEPFKKRTDPQSQVAYKKDPAPPYSLRGEARYTLFSYLTALSKGDYKRAAHYYGGAYNRLRRMNPSLNIARFKPEDYRYLKRYCTVNGGKCYIPTSIKDSVLGSNAKGLDSRFVQALGDISRSDGTMKFSVEFVSPGYEQLKVNGRTRFTFKVIKTSKGFKVLDLPPKKKVR